MMQSIRQRTQLLFKRRNIKLVPQTHLAVLQNRFDSYQPSYTCNSALSKDKIRNLNQATMCNGGEQKSFPSTMRGDPIKALVSPGNCQFNDNPVAVTLLDRWQVSPTSCVLRFGLPDPTKPLNLSTCACILAIATIDNEVVVRPYTPISTNSQIGSFDLLIKNYGPTSKMSHFMCDVLALGEMLVSFKHIEFNVKTQAPFPYKHIGMLVGGTGITPMVQALHAILGSVAEARTYGTEEPQIKVTMLYGSRTSDDILGKEILDSWSEKYPNHFDCIHVLSHEPENSSWSGHRGFINKELLEKCFPKPTEDDIQLFICGPPPMYDFFSGPRTEKEVKGLLGDIGYRPDQVYKF